MAKDDEPAGPVDSWNLPKGIEPWMDPPLREFLASLGETEIAPQVAAAEQMTLDLGWSSSGSKRSP